MTPRSIYDSERLAAGYAQERPPVHRHIAEEMAEYLRMKEPAGYALDVGCGAGLSTAALEKLAEKAVGLEPVPTMLKHSRVVAPRALFAVGRAERLPFPAARFDLLTAAGSLNYADLNLFLPEAARVLTPGGVMVIYDFSAGRRLRRSSQLDAWFSTFERRYPFPPDYDLEVRRLPYEASGLRLEAYHEQEVAISMSLPAYLRYAMTETNVEQAISNGVPEAEIREWCEETLREVFGDQTLDVLFDAYIAYVRKG